MQNMCCPKLKNQHFPHWKLHVFMKGILWSFTIHMHGVFKKLINWIYKPFTFVPLIFVPSVTSTIFVLLCDAKCSFQHHSLLDGTTDVPWRKCSITYKTTVILRRKYTIFSEVRMTVSWQCVPSVTVITHRISLLIIKIFWRQNLWIVTKICARVVGNGLS